MIRTCKNGHPATPENIAVYGGQKRCRICARAHKSKFRAKRMNLDSSGAGLATFKEIGKRLRMSPETARNLYSSAINKLRLRPELFSKVRELSTLRQSMEASRELIDYL